MEFGNKKKRSANFNNNEKSLKNEAWEIITQEFNSSGPSCPRSVECLKRCYDNRKKLLRKSVAFQRKEVYNSNTWSICSIGTVSLYL